MIDNVNISRMKSGFVAYVDDDGYAFSTAPDLLHWLAREFGGYALVFGPKPAEPMPAAPTRSGADQMIELVTRGDNLSAMKHGEVAHDQPGDGLGGAAERAFIHDPKTGRIVELGADIRPIPDTPRERSMGGGEDAEAGSVGSTHPADDGPAAAPLADESPAPLLPEAADDRPGTPSDPAPEGVNAGVKTEGDLDGQAAEEAGSESGHGSQVSANTNPEPNEWVRELVAIIAGRAGAAGWVKLPYGQLADMLECSAPTITAVTRAAADDGHILIHYIERGADRGNWYALGPASKGEAPGFDAWRAAQATATEPEPVVQPCVEPAPEPPSPPTTATEPATASKAKKPVDDEIPGAGVVLEELRERVLLFGKSTFRMKLSMLAERVELPIGRLPTILAALSKSGAITMQSAKDGGPTTFTVHETGR